MIKSAGPLVRIFIGQKREKLLTFPDYCDSMDYIDSLGGNNERLIIRWRRKSDACYLA